MNRLTEIVGKALYDNMCLANPHVRGNWESLPWDLKSYYSEQARAAIKAMRNFDSSDFTFTEAEAIRRLIDDTLEGHPRCP